VSKNTIKTYVLLAGLGFFLVMIGQVVGGSTGATLGLFLGIAFCGGSYWFSDKLAIRAARAVPADEATMPEYFRVVRELTEKAGMPMPKLYISPDMQPNAFATGRNPEHAAVAVTQGILQVCDWDELRGVLAHEISHVGNRDILIGSVAAAIATGIMFITRFALFFGGDDDDSPNPIVGLALLILAPVAGMLIQMAITRSREFEADRTGARLIGDGEPLARALAKLETAAAHVPMDVTPAQATLFIINPLTGRKVRAGNWFRTHPPTEDRIARLRGGDWRE